MGLPLALVPGPRICPGYPACAIGSDGLMLPTALGVDAVRTLLPELFLVSSELDEGLIEGLVMASGRSASLSRHSAGLVASSAVCLTLVCNSQETRSVAD